MSVCIIKYTPLSGAKLQIGGAKLKNNSAEQRLAPVLSDRNNHLSYYTKKAIIIRSYFEVNIILFGK